jgi:hypothetical protein
MSAVERRKGQAGERELHRLLSEHLGFVVRRNVDQARAGGADGIDIPGWAVECKRCEREQIGAWWAQAVRQAETLGRRPILFYRASRRPWRAVVDLNDISPEVWPRRGGTAVLDALDAVVLIRERLALGGTS